MGTRKENRFIGGCQRKRRRFWALAALLVVFQFLENVEIAAGEGDGKVQATENSTKAGETPASPPAAPVPQVRYRMRPVGAFRSNSSTKQLNNTSGRNSSEIPGAPSFAVHDLTSQTFEKLHENWRNLETFLRNLQVRRSQDESQRTPQNGGTPASPSGQGDHRDSRENTYRRFPPFNSNNVYTLRYHPVLEGQGSSAGDDGRIPPARTLGGVSSFNPFPYDPKAHGAKDVDMERHTVATIYTIGICLTIMAIGSVMFILINKCDGGNGNNYIRSGASAGPNTRVATRITRSMIGAVSSSRAAGRQGRTRRGARNAGANSHSDNASGGPDGIVSETDAKVLTDLPPSYDSLFPEGGPNLKVIVQPEPSTSSQIGMETVTVPETNVNLNIDSSHTISNNEGVRSSTNISNQNANFSQN